ncbi:MAG TPA: cytochrome c oxidase subunit 3 family protein, partial [Rhodocyclaceae bacterium]|nr:cytochrome c oxidase subunit 3 family protein [Rhodocyclaceae bacterium]
MASQVLAAEGRVPGNKGIWVGIFAEMTEFALLFLVYFVARAHNPEAFRDGPPRLNTTAGITNTLLMVTSSYFVARAVVEIRLARHRGSLLWLALATLGGAGYLVVKVLELSWNAAHGITGTSGIFFTVYYYLTFTHMVHVTWGILGALWVIARAA